MGFLFSALLLLALFASILQLIMFMHQRAVLIDLVGEAARFGARYDAAPDAGQRRVRELVHNRASITHVLVQESAIGDNEVLRLTVEADLVLLGMEVGQKVSGHAVIEQVD